MDITNTNVRQYYYDALKNALFSNINKEYFNSRFKIYPNGSGDYINTYTNISVFSYETYIEKLRKAYYRVCLEHVETENGSFEWFTGDWDLLGDEFIDNLSKKRRKKSHDDAVLETPISEVAQLQQQEQEKEYQQALKWSCRRLTDEECNKLPSGLPVLPNDQFYLYCHEHLVVCKDDFININGKITPTGRFCIVKSYEQIAGLPLKYIDCDDSIMFRLCNSELLALKPEQLSIGRDGDILDKERKNKLRAFKRARDRVYDIGMCNEWSYFFTGTFDDKKAGENSPENLLNKLQNWLAHQVQRKGLKYLLVAEYTPKNHRIHFHGLINDALSMSYSGKVRAPFKGCKGMSEENAVKHGYSLDECQKIYILDDWSKKFGFTSCIRLTGDKINTIRYVCKYISKDCDKIFGNYFWSSRNIVRDPPLFLGTVNFDHMPGEVFGNGFTQFKYDCSFRQDNSV